MKSLHTLLATTLIGAAAATVVLPAVAADALAYTAADPPERTVSIRDLDLNEPSHLPIVYARLQRTAAALCDSTVRSERRLRRRVPKGWRDECVRGAVDEAVRNANDQRLTALHSRRAELMAGQQ